MSIDAIRSFAPRRPLGRDGFRVTAVGAGDLADRALSLATCAATLRRALAVGINVVDTAPMYEDGFSEEIVGEAIRGRRDSLFVIDKIDHFDRPVDAQLAASLGRLRTDRVDLAVFHSVSRPEDWERLSSGRFAELERARDRGDARNVGISSHHPDVLRAAIESGRCDVVMLPVGPFVDRRYTDEILPLARARGVGTVSFKTFGGGKLVADTIGYGRPVEDASPNRETIDVASCIRLGLTLDADVMLLGLSNAEEQDAAFAAIRAFEPLTAAEIDDVRARAARAVRGKGKCWWNPD